MVFTGDPMTRRSTRPASQWWQDECPAVACRFPDGEVVCDDALHFLSLLKPECASVVLLDPPFNLGKTYGRRNKSADRLDDQCYFDYISGVIQKSKEVLRPGGALFLYHIPRWAVKFAPVLGNDMLFRHWIAVSMKNGFPRGKYLHPAHYALLYYTKGQPSRFSRPKTDPATCRHCGGLVKDYGGYKKFVEHGVNLSDVWEDISPVRHRKYKHRRSNELPMKIPNRVMEISGMRGGLLIDPFSGSGPALIAARKGGMFFVGCDRDRTTLSLARKRLEVEPT